MTIFSFINIHFLALNIEHFKLEEAEAIMQILLPKRLNEIQLVWHYDKREQYLVKSGY